MTPKKFTLLNHYKYPKINQPKNLTCNYAVDPCLFFPTFVYFFYSTHFLFFLLLFFSGADLNDVWGYSFGSGTDKSYYAVVGLSNGIDFGKKKKKFKNN